MGNLRLAVFIRRRNLAGKGKLINRQEKRMDIEQEIEGMDLLDSLVFLANRLTELTGANND
jgi:hypothetical protein